MKRRSKPNGHHRGGKTNGKANHMANRVTKLAPDKPEARDEGPRLIPLDGVGNDGARDYEHYGRAVELADIALGNKKNQKNKSFAASPPVTRHGQPAKSAIKGRPPDA